MRDTLSDKTLTLLLVVTVMFMFAFWVGGRAYDFGAANQYCVGHSGEVVERDPGKALVLDDWSVICQLEDEIVAFGPKYVK